MDERESEKIAMPELFDMIAGSETGAIIASSLLLKNDDPVTMATQPNKFFANKSMEYFVNNVDILYKDSQMPFFMKALITIFTIVVVSSLSYLYTEKAYDYPDFDRKIENLKALMSMRKKQVKGKDFDQEKYDESESFCKTDIRDDTHKEKHKLLNVLAEFEAVAANDEYDQSEKLERIVKLEDELEMKIKSFNNKMGYKWISLMISLIVTYGLVYWAILPGVNFLFLSTKDASDLKIKINEIIPAEL